MRDVAAWRAQLLEGAAIWSARGRHHVDGDGGLALSGIGGTDGNVAFCFADSSDAMRATTQVVLDAPVPTVALVGASALGWVQILVDGGLVCVGASAFMHLSTSCVESRVDRAVRRLNVKDLDKARAVVEGAYADGSSMPSIALPPEAVESQDWEIWGLEDEGRLVSVVTTSSIGDSTGIWSMSTPTSLQKRGYGRRLLDAVLAAQVGGGTDHVLLYASSSGERLYRAAGFEVVEHWQQWTRPRWIPGRT